MDGFRLHMPFEVLFPERLAADAADPQRACRGALEQAVAANVGDGHRNPRATARASGR